MTQPFSFLCPKCSSQTMVITAMPDLLRTDRCVWVVKCGGGHLVHPSPTDRIEIAFRD